MIDVKKITCEQCKKERPYLWFRKHTCGKRATVCRSCDRENKPVKLVEGVEKKVCKFCGRLEKLKAFKGEKMCRYCFKNQPCDCGCGKHGELVFFRKRWLHEDCLNSDMKEATIEDIMNRQSMFGCGIEQMRREL